MLQHKFHDRQPPPERGLHQRRPFASVDIVEVATLVIKELNHLIIAFDYGQGDTVSTTLVSPDDERVILLYVSSRDATPRKSLRM